MVYFIRTIIDKNIETNKSTNKYRSILCRSKQSIMKQYGYLTYTNYILIYYDFFNQNKLIICKWFLCAKHNELTNELTTKI